MLLRGQVMRSQRRGWVWQMTCRRTLGLSCGMALGLFCGIWRGCDGLLQSRLRLCAMHGMRIGAVHGECAVLPQSLYGMCRCRVHRPCTMGIDRLGTCDAFPNE